MSNVGQGVLTIVGAAVGFIASGFNPAGAYWGAQLSLAEHDENTKPRAETGGLYRAEQRPYVMQRRRRRRLPL